MYNVSYRQSQLNYTVMFAVMFAFGLMLGIQSKQRSAVYFVVCILYSILKEYNQWFVLDTFQIKFLTVVIVQSISFEFKQLFLA